MSLLELILIFVLHFEAGISGEPIYVYNRPGHNAILPCTSASPSDRQRHIATWFYNKYGFHESIEVWKGNVVESSTRAARMSLDSSCSLVINNITPEDAGLYIYGYFDTTEVYLSVLTISPSPPDADPKRDGEVKLVCFLLRYTGLGPCKQNSLRWVDETGTVLLDEGVGYKFIGQKDCVSVLKVKRQSGHNRRYTCQFVDENNVKIEADYTPVFIGGTGDDQPEKPHSAGISGEPIYLYNRSGHDVILPCTSASPYDTTCSIVTWFYNRDQSQSFIEVWEGKVEKRSARAARMSLVTSCSLVINNITAEDAGQYACRQGTSLHHDAVVYLSVLTISPSPPDADPKRDGEVTLDCSLSRYIELGPCKQNSVRWVDETGTVLLDEGVGYKFIGQMNCVSVLKVKRQSGHNRTYTCQFVDENNVKIEADYTPVFIGGTGDDQPEKPHSAGSSGEPIYLYNRSGHDVILPCASASPYDTTCSIITWLYSRDRSQTLTEVQEGKVEKSSARAARMSLDTSCSLAINNITAEDAGQYTCRHGTSPNKNATVYLSVLTISPSPPDADPKRDGEVTLECSLSRYIGLDRCELNSVRWVNETGTVLLDEGVGYKFLKQKDCVSVLKVKRQSGHNRRYTCQFVDENNVKIEADYTPVFIGGTGDDQPEKPHSAGISGEPIYLYNRSGHDVILPCTSASPSDTTCSIVTWLYNRDRSQTLTEVRKGKVVESSARAARMSLDTSCSLVINNITAEDIGQYACRQGTSPNHDAIVYLSVLTISPSPPDADPKRDGEVTLDCSLSRYNVLGPCKQNSVRWVNETGTVLLDEGVGYKFIGQMNCVSVLKVKRQSGHNRRYTCQFVDENNVKIEADYTPVFIGGIGDDQPEKPHSAGISGEPIYLYNRSGHDVILPCASASPYDTTCSIITWFYNRDQSQSFTEVQEGKVEKRSARAARISLVTSCSLVINNITAEDAGQYICRQGTSLHHDANLYLSVLTISPSPPDADPKRDGEVTLECSLLRWDGLGPCKQNRVRWVDETGTVLLDEGVGYKFLGQKDCVSVLKVKRQSGHNKTYTCQFVDENNVKIEADYTPVFIGGTGDGQPAEPYSAGISGEPIYLYNRSGHDVILPCASASPSDTTCSNVTWIYSRDRSQSFIEVWEGKVEKSSARAARMSLDTSCSLVINNITAEDIGQYACRHGTSPNQSATVYLSVLTISPSRPDADPKRDGEVTLECSLSRYYGLDRCEQNSVRWVNETGTVLLDEGVGYKFIGQKNCVSVLKVKRQSGHNRTFTCLFVDENNVKIEADYTPVFIGGIGDDQLVKPHSDQFNNQTYIIIGAVVGVVVVLVIIAAVLIKYRKRAKVTVDVQKPTQHTHFSTDDKLPVKDEEEPESNLTYVTVSHANQQTSPKKKVKEEEEVTYSTVKTSLKTEADDDPSGLYSYVSQPK
ncbi:uncharacterized protein LOC127368569 [Dicentrarchus labrax]|uniref:uncharacterized protein LOC127368569 n=1 Tax=Dicentrarchus labrax TaxID=13489 RepID=UPI0021F55066|nr:uncharacterized protein LOC127368569 [Dicentrarchus labrax]